MWIEKQYMEIIDIYSDSSRILLIGPLPPPYGGVSVHIKRLKKLLDKAGFNTNTFYRSDNHNSILLNALILFKKIIFGNYNIVHIHGYFRAYALVVFVARYLISYRIYYTVHNPRLFQNKNGIAIFLINKFIEKIDCLVLVSKDLIKDFKRNKVRLPKKVFVCNAFLPPPEEDEPGIIDTYSAQTLDFVSNHKPLIIANASRICFYNDIDLYGLDLCIELSAVLKKKYPKIGLLFSLANENVNSDYIEKKKRRISELDIEENFFFMTGQKELWPLYKRADIGVRPTATDGDAVSIREALCFKTPVVASDVVSRPKNTITFKHRDLCDLCHQVEKALESTNQKSKQELFEG
jgi:glycosyltransferase involved in cell wall biosynthesis